MQEERNVWKNVSIVLLCTLALTNVADDIKFN
jgi:hypothetical protein